MQNYCTPVQHYDCTQDFSGLWNLCFTVSLAVWAPFALSSTFGHLQGKNRVFFLTRLHRSNAWYVLQIWHCPTNLQNTVDVLLLLKFRKYPGLYKIHAVFNLLRENHLQAGMTLTASLKTVLHVTICHVQWFELQGQEYLDKNNIQTPVRNGTGKMKIFVLRWFKLYY